jgi:hypothetical protein
MNTTHDNTTGGPVTVGTHPVTLHVPDGTALFALRGEAWITQEGLRDDIILAPGQRFVAHGRGALVVSATRAPVDLLMVRPALARAYPSADVYEFARSYAAHLRRQAIARAAATAAAALRSLVARARGSMTARPRMPA